MARPLSLSDRGQSLGARGAHQRKRISLSPSLQRRTSLNQPETSAVKQNLPLFVGNDQSHSGKPHLFASTFVDFIDLASEDIPDGPILTLGQPPLRKYPSSEEQPHTPNLSEGFSEKRYQNRNESFSPEVARFLDIFNKSALPLTSDNAAKERCAVPEQPCNSFLRKDRGNLRHGNVSTISKPAPPSQVFLQSHLVRPGGEATIEQSIPKKPGEPPQAVNPPQKEYEKIHDILKTIGVNLGVTEIGKLSVRAQERCHRNERLSRSPEHTNSSESNTHPQVTAWPRKASNDRSSQPLTNHSKDRDMVKQMSSPVLGRELSTPVSELKIPPVVLMQKVSSPVLGQPVPSALGNNINNPVLENTHAPVHSAQPLMNVPPLVPQYHIPNFTTAQMPQHYVPLPPQTLGYGQYMPAPGWPVCPPQHPNPALPPTIPTNHPHTSLGMAHTISMNKELNIGGTAPVHSHAMGTMQASHLAREPLSDEKNQEFEKHKVMEERARLKIDREARQNKILFLQGKLVNLRNQIGLFHHKNHLGAVGPKDPGLEELNKVHEYLISEIAMLTKEDSVAAEKQSELDTVAEILGIDTGKSRKQSTESKEARVEKGRTQEKSRSPEKLSRWEKSRSQEKNSKSEELRNIEKNRKPERARRSRKRRKRERSISQENESPPNKDSCHSKKKYHSKSIKSTPPSSDTAVPLSDRYEYYDAGNHWCRDCNTFCGTLLDFFSHMHHKKHQQTLDPYTRPWATETQVEVKQDPKKSPTKVTVPAKGSEFLIPITGFFCTLCEEFLGDQISAEQHVKCYNHNENYKKYIERNLLYEERRNLDRQAGLAVAMEAKRRRERELKRKLEESSQEDEEDAESMVAKKTQDLCTIKQDKVAIKSSSAQESQSRNITEQQQVTKHGPTNNKEQRNASKIELLATSAEEATASCTADNTDESISIYDKQGNPVQASMPKPISITIAKRPVRSPLNQQNPVAIVQAKIRPDLPVPSMVQRKCGTAAISKPAPLNAFLSIKSGPGTKSLTLMKSGTDTDLVLAQNESKAIGDSQVLTKESNGNLKIPEIVMPPTQPNEPLITVACGHAEGSPSKTHTGLKAPEMHEPFINLKASTESVACGDEKVNKNRTQKDDPKTSPPPQSPIQVSNIALEERTPSVTLNEQTICAVPVKPPSPPPQIVNGEPNRVENPKFSHTMTNHENLSDVFCSSGETTSDLNSLSSNTNKKEQKVSISELENKISGVKSTLGSLSHTKSAFTVSASTPLESSHTHPATKTKSQNEIKIIPESMDSTVKDGSVSVIHVVIKETSELIAQSDMAITSQDSHASAFQVIQNSENVLLSGGLEAGTSESCTHLVEVKNLELSSSRSDVSQSPPSSQVGIVNEDKNIQVSNITAILPANKESVPIGNAGKEGGQPDVTLKMRITQTAGVQDKVEDDNVLRNKRKSMVSEYSLNSEREGEVTVPQLDSPDKSMLDTNKKEVVLESVQRPPDSARSQTDSQVKQSTQHIVETEKSNPVSEAENIDTVVMVVNPEVAVTSVIDTQQGEVVIGTLGNRKQLDTSGSAVPAQVFEIEQTDEMKTVEETIVFEVSKVIPALFKGKSSDASDNVPGNIKQDNISLDVQLQRRQDPTHTAVLDTDEQVLSVQQQPKMEVNLEIQAALAAQDTGTILAVEIAAVSSSYKADEATASQLESCQDLQDRPLAVANQETYAERNPCVLASTAASKSEVDVNNTALGIYEGNGGELPISLNIEVEDALTKAAVPNLTGALPENVVQSSSSQVSMLNLDEDPERNEKSTTHVMTSESPQNIETINISSPQTEVQHESLTALAVELKTENIVGGPLTSAGDLNPPKASAFDLVDTYSELDFEHPDSHDQNFRNEDGPSGVVKADLKCSDPDPLKAELELEPMDFGLGGMEEHHEHLSIFPAENVPDDMDDTPELGNGETIDMVAEASSVLHLRQTVGELEMINVSTVTSVDGTDESFCNLRSKSTESACDVSEMPIVELQGVSPLSEIPMQIEEHRDEDCNMLVLSEHEAGQSFAHIDKTVILDPSLPEILTTAEEDLVVSTHWAARTEPNTPTTEKVVMTVNVLECRSSRFSVVPDPTEDSDSPDESEEAAYLSD